MRAALAVAIAASLALGGAAAVPQAPQDYLTHPAVRENLNLRTRVVMLEIALYELQDQHALQQQRIVDLEAAVALIDPAYFDAMIQQLQAQQQVLVQEVKVVETVSDPGEQ